MNFVLLHESNEKKRVANINVQPIVLDHNEYIKSTYWY